MNANYRIIRIGKKYFPQTRFQHVEPTIGGIQPIHDWIYFKSPNGDDMSFNTYQEALNACIKAEESEKFDEIIELEIYHGVVIENKKIR